MRRFTIADIPADVRERSNRAAKKWQEVEEAHEWSRRVTASQIPEAYQDAKLVNMPMLTAWADAFGQSKEQRPDGNILLLGVAGCGKTTAACAVGMSVLKHCSSVRFTTAPGYIREIQSAMDGYVDRNHVFTRYAYCRLLILDDLGKGKPTDWSTTELWELINYRMAHEKPTIITTQYNEERLSQRLANGSDQETAQAMASRIFGNEWMKLVPGNVDRRKAACR